MINNLKNLLNEEQDPKAVEKILEKVTGLLTKDEEIDYIAVQKKPAINISPECIALTNKRIIFCRPKTFGLSMTFTDYMWKEIADCHMKEGILGATFTAQTTLGTVEILDYLPKAQARKLYQYAQGKEEEMMDVRRQKTLEETRAAAGGGITINNGNPAEETANKQNDANDPLVVLQKLKSLLESGIITSEEFENKKKEILDKM